METYSERSAAGFIKSEAAVPKERQPQLLWSATELWKGGVSALLRLARQAGPETGVPPGLAVVGHHADHRLIVPHHDEQALGPGDSGV